MSFRDIAVKLAAAGHTAKSGKPLSPIFDRGVT